MEKTRLYIFKTQKISFNEETQQVVNAVNVPLGSYEIMCLIHREIEAADLSHPMYRDAMSSRSTDIDVEVLGRIKSKLRAVFVGVEELYHSLPKEV